VAGGDRKGADAALIAAIASGATIRDASVTAGVAESTAYRRLRDAAFQRQVSTARGEMLARAVGMLANASTRAVITLTSLLDGESESVRLSAAKSIIELGSKLRESTELEARILELEARAAEATTPAPVERRRVR
jgi:hypothetical protein